MKDAGGSKPVVSRKQSVFEPLTKEFFVRERMGGESLKEYHERLAGVKFLMKRRLRGRFLEGSRKATNKDKRS